MTEVIVVTSGKGGVGKTTSSASISTGLALHGHKTVVIDFDIGLRNLDLANATLPRPSSRIVIREWTTSMFSPPPRPGTRMP